MDLRKTTVQVRGPWGSEAVERGPASVAVLLMHRQAIVREGIHSLLQRTDSFRVAVDCERPEEAVARLETHACDLVLAELGGAGLQLAHRLSRLHPDLPVVMVADERPRLSVIGVALDFQVRACVSLQDPDDIRRGLEAVARNKRYLTPTWAMDVLREPASQPGVAPLSDRELQILEAFDNGTPLAEVARELHVSPSTIKSHLARIYRKLGVKRRGEACAVARDLGLIPIQAKD